MWGHEVEMVDAGNIMIISVLSQKIVYGVADELRCVSLVGGESRDVAFTNCDSERSCPIHADASGYPSKTWGVRFGSTVGFWKG